MARQAERTARYEQIMVLQKQGVTSAEIARQLGVTPRTIQRWIALESIPYSRPRRQRPRLIDPYKTYLLARRHHGCHKGAQKDARTESKRLQRVRACAVSLVFRHWNQRTSLLASGALRQPRSCPIRSWPSPPNKPPGSFFAGKK